MNFFCVLDCPEHEVFQYCEPCNLRVCGEVKKLICPYSCKIVQDCYCDEGWARDSTGKCIPEDRC